MAVEQSWPMSLVTLLLYSAEITLVGGGKWLVTSAVFGGMMNGHIICTRSRSKSMSVSHDIRTQSQTKLTYEHYVQYPEDGNRHEIIDGVHYMNSAPVPQHQKISRHIQFQLFSAIELNGLGQVMDAPVDIQFSNHDVVQPDLVVVLTENRIITTTKVKGVPDLVVEILSPSTAQRDEGLKKELYEQSGVPEYWVVDPDEKSVRKYALTNQKYGEAVRCVDTVEFDGLPDIVVDLTRVW
jgi:Uma2 family endonuclease